MIKQVELVLLPEEATDEQKQKKAASISLGLPLTDISALRIVKRSIDARGRKVKIRLLSEVYLGETPSPENYNIFRPQNVSARPEVLIVGAGPAGLFAALQLIECGLKPVILERGKDVRSRRHDLAAINKQHIINPDSNYCFGEGGAGTYSDGKLYTRSNKRGDVKRILKLLVQHGADPEILINAHPHIGTNKLPQVVTAIRQTIIDCGGEIHFNTRLEDIHVTGGKLNGVTLSGNTVIKAQALILATGHSARDIYELFDRKKLLIEHKPFALGVRIEHPQTLIDSAQYHCSIPELNTVREFLPAASYSFVEQVRGRGVFSFCMCPGGIIAPCATAPGEIVTNGWSPSKRNNPFANSGIVVAVEPEDTLAFKDKGALAGMYFQKTIEQQAWKLSNENNLQQIGQTAPAQRMVDFVNGKVSATLPKVSYLPGVKSLSLDEVLPSVIGGRLKEAFKLFGKKMPGYYTNEAVLVGVESRTSTPVRIPRDKDTLQHPQVEGLFPCGEGAGYAGGIISAAMDGEACAKACFSHINV